MNDQIASNGVDATQHLDLDTLDLDGHTVEELSDYLDAGRSPRNASIEDSVGCRLVLESLERLRALTPDLVNESNPEHRQVDDNWMQRLLGSIALDARAGARIPLAPPSSTVDIGITEGAVRGIVRAAEAVVPGIVVGRIRIDGDIERFDAEVGLRIDTSIVYGINGVEAAASLRNEIVDRLGEQLAWRIRSIDLAITDVILLHDEAAARENGAKS